MTSKTYALIAAAGESRRMGGSNKILMPIAGKPLIAWTLEAFELCSDINEIIIIGHNDWLEEYWQVAKEFKITKVKSIIPGGKERQDSVYCGLKEVLANGVADDDLISIHNGANCLISVEDISACLAAAKEYGASVAAFPAQDTIKEVGEDLFVIKTLERKKLWQMQTPQTIRIDIAKRAFVEAFAANFYGTDDVQLVERLGLPVKIVKCSVKNKKVTTPEDAQYCQLLLQDKGE
ncbi:MAG: 2-C-methyl-D-erythritol 4-phosphate cytidylyltransferase [Deltaproteobacteria bacterium]|nr:2-C-methyl-D-erythritol 4-phosphate cytidylyltransferase [Deltaproteobacteria bacterium]